MVPLPETGYITLLAYTSTARIPLENVAIAVTAQDGTVLALRLTDRNGQISPIEIPVPPLAESQTPDPGVVTFTAGNLYARLVGYEQTENENLQVFADTVTQLPLQMIPLSEFPNAWDKIAIYNTPAQNL